MKTTENNTNISNTNPEIIIETTINSKIDRAFDYIPPINLMHIFRGNSIIPAIIDTSIKQGWNKAGLKRTVYFADGSTSQETLLTVDAPTSFSYKNEHFTSKVLAALLKRIEGEWLFTDLGNNHTKIRWIYRPVPTSVLAKLVVKLALLKPIRTTLSDALEIIKNDLESGQLEKGTTWKTQEQNSDLIQVLKKA